jgi:proteic killer suppression protein
VTQVEFTRGAYKDIASLPTHIVGKLKTWVAAVELVGLAEVRKRPGLHDEPLKGERKGQRSVRLSKAY